MSFGLLPTAQLELDEAVHVFGLIQQFPLAWHPLSANTRRCRLKRFPYGVIYAVEANKILVLAIAHLHRKPGYWSGRIGTIT